VGYVLIPAVIYIVKLEARLAKLEVRLDVKRQEAAQLLQIRMARLVRGEPVQEVIPGPGVVFSGNRR